MIPLAMMIALNGQTWAQLPQRTHICSSTAATRFNETGDKEAEKYDS